MKRVFIFLCYVPFLVDTNLKNYKSMQIKNLKIIRCDSKKYPVSINNVTVHIGTKPKIQVTGSLSSEVDLVGPVQALVWLKRDIWGLWIPVPCEENLGSCTYNNLCDYGYPKNTTCPQAFVQNNVPCRCPIKKGNYTILPSIELSKETSIISGTYKATVEVSQKNVSLACYNVNFVLYDQSGLENEVYSVTQVF